MVQMRLFMDAKKVLFFVLIQPSDFIVEGGTERKLTIVAFFPYFFHAGLVLAQSSFYLVEFKSGGYGVFADEGSPILEVVEAPHGIVAKHLIDRPLPGLCFLENARQAFLVL